jgi:DNA-binding MarR family transcriptional regulator
MPLKKASERLQVHPTSITNAVDRLEAAALVTRSPHPTDGRATLVRITDAGREAATAATAVLNAELFGLRALEPAAQEGLIDVLTTLRADVGDFG